MRSFLLTGLMLVTLIARSEAGGQSLRGSRASVDYVYARAVSSSLTFFRSHTGVVNAAMKGDLRLLPITLDMTLEDVRYPFLLPRAHDFTVALAARYRAACGERLVVTSATRPQTQQPANASPKSVHPTGMAVDFRRPTGACLEWLRSELLSLERERIVDATEERRPPHFHVAVLRAPPAAYTAVADATRSNAGSDPTPAAATMQPVAADADPVGPVRGVTYVVQSGDTLWGIARRYGTTVERLQEVNGLKGSKLRPGQVIRVA